MKFAMAAATSWEPGGQSWVKTAVPARFRGTFIDTVLALTERALLW